MDDATPITDLDAVPERGTYLFTVEEAGGREEEVVLVRTGDGSGDGSGSDDDDDGDGDGSGPEREVVAWKNFCMHEPDQRLDRGGSVGAAVRDGRLICPRHGSMFDAATGRCDNGPAAGQALVGVDVAVEDGTVYLTADGLEYRHAGGIDDGDDDGLPDSTSHLSF